MQKRRVGKLNPLFNETVLINEKQFESEYFRVSDVPSELTSGKNMFKLYGNSELLKMNTPLLIQVTDINKNPVYHHVNKFVDETGRIVIGVWLYPDTPPGLGKIELLGVATRRQDGREVPTNWKDSYNVKWQRELMLNPFVDNTTPIVFQTIPNIQVKEKVRTYLAGTYENTSTSVVTQTGTGTYSYGGGAASTFTLTDTIFSSSAVVNSTIIITPPANTNLWLPGEISLDPNASDDGIPLVSFLLENGLQNNTTAEIADIWTVPIVTNQQSAGTTVGKTYVPGVWTSVPSNFTPFVINNCTYSLEFQQELTSTVETFNSQSFADITLKNIDPIVGKVHTMKTFMKSAGFANYQLVSEDVLFERNLLIDKSSTLAYDSMGDITSQDVLYNFWASSSVNQTIVPGVSQDDSVMMSSMVITGSELLTASTNYPDSPLATDPYIMVSSSVGIDLFQGNEYTVKFKIVCEPDTATSTKTSLMDVYISGSSIGATDGRNIGAKIVSLETDPEFVPPSTVTNVSTLLAGNDRSAIFEGDDNYTPSLNTSKSIPGKFAPNTQNQLNTSATATKDLRLLKMSYTPTLDTSAHLVFAVTRGKWYISDIQIEGSAGQGYSPNHTFLEFPLTTAQSDDVLDFKFEFYNSKGDISNITLTTQSLDFVGSNTFITGDGNIISGSFDLGGGIIMKGF